MPGVEKKDGSKGGLQVRWPEQAEVVLEYGRAVNPGAFDPADPSLSVRPWPKRPRPPETPLGVLVPASPMIP